MHCFVTVGTTQFDGLVKEVTRLEFMEVITSFALIFERRV